MNYVWSLFKSADNATAPDSSEVLGSESQGRVWFVTGTTRGLGNELLKLLLEEGERVVATCRKPSDLDEFKTKYPSTQLLVQPLDVTDVKQIKEAFEATKRHFGRLDVVVNSAGFTVLGEIEGMTDEDARSQFDVLFWGPANITREAATFFREVNPPGDGGLVLNLTAAGGYTATQGFAYFCSAKFALEGFTQTFMKEMVPEWNIRACIVEPGAFAIPNRTSSITIRPQHPAYSNPNTPTSLVRTYLHHIPVPGDPQKAAKMIMKLSREPELPTRFQLGSDSLAAVKSQAQATTEEAVKFAQMSCSTDK